MNHHIQNVTNNKVERHVVLVGPQVPWNTGNIGRTCLGTGACLHLIKPLGFSLENRELKRAGLDYWQNVKLSVWDDFKSFQKRWHRAHKKLQCSQKTGPFPFGPCRVRIGFFSFSDQKPGDFRKRWYPNIITPPTTSPLHQIFGV